MPERSRTPAVAPLVLSLLLILGIGALWVFLEPWGSRPEGADPGFRPRGAALGADTFAAEELTPAPRLGAGPTGVESRVDESAAVDRAPELDRRVELRSPARLLPGPSLIVQVLGPQPERPVSRGTVALVLDVEVREGKLAREEDARSALLASAPLDRFGRAIFEELPTMSNAQVVEVAVVAPGYDQRGEHNRLEGERVILMPGPNEVVVTLHEVERVRGRVSDSRRRSVGAVDLLALPIKLEQQPSKSDLRVQALMREGLRSGRPELWQLATARGGGFELPLVADRGMYLYCLSPEWSLDPFPIEAGNYEPSIFAEPRTYLRVEHELVAGSWHADFFGDPEQLAWRVDAEALEVVADAARGPSTEPELEAGDVWIRGLGHLDFALETITAKELEALDGMVRDHEDLQGALRWRGRLFSGPLSSELEVDLLELGGLEESIEVRQIPELFVDVEPNESVVRVLHPDGQDAPGVYAFDSKLGVGPLFVGSDGHGALELVPGWGDFLLGIGELEDEHDRELWAGDYRGWMTTAVQRGEAGSVTHAFVDRATRFRVHPPMDHEDRFAVRLSARHGETWRRIDETSPTAEPVDWARLPYGEWLVERLDENGAVLDSLVVALGRARPMQLAGDGELKPWEDDLALVAGIPLDGLGEASR